jgi:hypothetical protein
MSNHFMPCHLSLLKNGTVEKFLKMVVRLPCMMLEITSAAVAYSSSEPSGSLSSLLPLVTIATHQGHRFCPFIPPLVPFLVPLRMALDGAARLLPRATFPLPGTKIALLASLPEACRVVISSNSLVVLTGSRPSSCTEV